LAGQLVIGDMTNTRGCYNDHSKVFRVQIFLYPNVCILTDQPCFIISGWVTDQS